MTVLADAAGVIVILSYDSGNIPDSDRLAC